LDSISDQYLQLHVERVFREDIFAFFGLVVKDEDKKSSGIEGVGAIASAVSSQKQAKEANRKKRAAEAKPPDLSQLIGGKRGKVTVGSKR
jgi:hypothetical protein